MGLEILVFVRIKGEYVGLILLCCSVLMQWRQAGKFHGLNKTTEAGLAVDTVTAPTSCLCVCVCQRALCIVFYLQLLRSYDVYLLLV